MSPSTACSRISPRGAASLTIPSGPMGCSRLEPAVWWSSLGPPERSDGGRGLVGADLVAATASRMSSAGPAVTRRVPAAGLVRRRRRRRAARSRGRGRAPRRGTGPSGRRCRARAPCRAGCRASGGSSRAGSAARGSAARTGRR